MNSLMYGISGSSWNPNRTKIIKKIQPNESIKRKILKEVQKSREKYKIPDYQSEVTRGKNPLYQSNERKKTIIQNQTDNNIIEKLSEGIQLEKQLLQPVTPTLIQTIPLNSIPTTNSIPLKSIPIQQQNNTKQSIVTGLSLVNKFPSNSNSNFNLSDSLTSSRLNSPSLLNQSKHKKNHLSSTSSSSINLSKSQYKSDVFLTDIYHNSNSVNDINNANITTNNDTTTTNNNYNKTQISSNISNDVPELYIASKYHPHPIPFNENLSITNISPLKPISSNSVIQPNSAYPFNSFGPWIPNGGMGVMISDKSDKLLNWEENRDVNMYCPYDNTKIKTVLKRQNVIRNSFESYTHNISNTIDRTKK